VSMTNPEMDCHRRANPECVQRSSRRLRRPAVSARSYLLAAAVLSYRSARAEYRAACHCGSFLRRPVAAGGATPSALRHDHSRLAQLRPCTLKHAR